ncbi:MAG: alpha/beta fold hydrolase [Haloarculaceae archaeon]
MKLRNLLAGSVAAAGATALANRVLAARASGFDHFLDAEWGTYRWRGFDVAYAEAGDPDDPDLVFLHGVNAAASSHEYHAVFEELAEEYHVIAPDLPGFGHSDRPPLLYSASLLTRFVTDFLADTVEDPTVIASSLTAAYAAAAAGEVPVAELFFLCPTDTTMGGGGRRPLVRSLFRSPLVGQGLFNLLVSKPGLRYFHEDHGYADMRNLTDEVLDYEWTTSHQPGARFAPASFVSGYLDPEEDLESLLADLDVPVTFVWGRDADITPVSVGRDLAEAVDARLVVIDDSRLLPHVEHPEAFADVVRGEYAVAKR